MIDTALAQLLHGYAELEQTARGIRPHRLPAWVRSRFPDPQLLSVEVQPSGVRAVFGTAARQIELVTHPTRLAYRGIERPRGSVDLVVDGAPVASDLLADGDAFETDLATGQTRPVPGSAHVSRFLDLPAGEKRVELWLPHNEAVELVALRTDAPVVPIAPQGRLWVHHGSSISHGSNAATPAGIWPVIAARVGDVELRNLGLGGSALVDPFLAQVIRDSPADLISVKLGINVVNLDGMRLRTFVPAVHGFLDTIRDGHPTTPLLVVSPLYCGIHEDTPGPGAFDPDALAAGQVRIVATGQPGDRAIGRLTLTVVREALAGLVAQRGDPNLYYLDGTSLYGPDDALSHPLPDALHPDPASHDLIGRRFAEQVFGPGRPFAGR